MNRLPGNVALMLRRKLKDVRWLLVKIKISFLNTRKCLSVRAKRGNIDGVQRKIIVPFKQWSEFLMKKRNGIM
jgi:hypothetical protein